FLGIIPVAMGQFVCLVISVSWLRTISINNYLYHIGSMYIGSLFSIITLIGMLLLTTRCITQKSVRKLSSASDIIVNFLLLIIICMGCYAILVSNAVTADFDYRT